MSDQENEQLFIRGFNTGYEISKSDPELLSVILAPNNELSTYIEGMRAGQTESLKELALEELKGKVSVAIPDYQRSFNHGYMIAKHDPELAEELAKVADPGFYDGAKQFHSEEFEKRLPGWLKKEQLPDKPEDRSPDKEPDRDIEPDL